MKTVFTLFFLALISLSVKAQSTVVRTHNIYCSNITTIEASNEVKNYLLTTYPARITSYVADLDSKSALITSDLEPIDLLQLYRMQGYVAIYLSNGEGRFQLNDNGNLMVGIKE